MSVAAGRLAALDGVRGVAAFAVLTFHIGHWLQAPWLSPNGGLAVDAFFTLSGYVLCLAYEPKAATLSLVRFMALRLIRLMPMIVLATVLSAAYLTFKSLVLHEPISGAALLAATVLGLLNLPYLYAPAAIGGPQVFPLNGPQYSLFFEVAANAVWWINRFLPQLALAAFVALISAVVIVFVGLGGDRTANFWTGFAHVGASFALGVLLFQVSRFIPPWRGWAALFGFFAAAAAGLMFWPFELPFVWLLAFKFAIAPIMVLTGAHVALGPRLAAIALQAGALSYPLYALHYPIFCWLNGAYQFAFGAQDAAIEGTLLAVAAIAGAWLALKFYDEPVRRWLGGLLTRPPSATVTKAGEYA